MLIQANAINLDDLIVLMPQTPPFRFVDRLVEIDDRHVRTEYRFRGDEYFYTGHFHGDPVTPGVILVEAMAQGGVVLQALYLLAKESGESHGTRLRTVLTDVEMEIRRPVVPPESVTIHSELAVWRARRIRSVVSMFNEQGDLVATGKIAGKAVPVA